MYIAVTHFENLGKIFLFKYSYNNLNLLTIEAEYLVVLPYYIELWSFEPVNVMAI